jgi:hypothetical protein
VAKQLFPVLKNFPPVLTHVLAVPDGETSDCGLKMEVLRVSWDDKKYLNHTTSEKICHIIYTPGIFIRKNCVINQIRLPVNGADNITTVPVHALSQ